MRRCKTFLIDPPFLFAMGSLFALAGRRRLVVRSPNPFGLSAGAAVGFALLFWVSVTWFVWNAPDWMLSYFVSAERVSMPLLHGLFGVALVLAAVSGHTLTAVLIQRGHIGLARGILAVGLLLLGGLWGLTMERYMAYGTHQAFLNGETIAVTESSMAGMMNWVGIVQGLAAAILLLWVHVDGKRLRAR